MALSSHASSPGLREPVIIVQGGAGAYTEDVAPSYHPGIQEAARVGYSVLQGHTGSALDAVEAAVCCMENNPRFNSGCGSYLNSAGEVEMDAIIMEGKTLKSGAVACVRDIKNPVTLARAVLEKTEHDFLIGRGLEDFIDEQRFTRVDQSELITEKGARVYKEWLEEKSGNLESSEKKGEEHGTVGAVALDRNGNIACATSTGGTRGQSRGRVGDVPIIGCGAYCDNAVGGISTTGCGEAIMRTALAARVLFYMEQGLSGRDAAKKSLEFLRQRTSQTPGLVVLSADGEAEPVFLSVGMSWAMIKQGHLSYGVMQGEVLDGGSV